jgi:putative membrane protein insertion efficiency factor
VFNAQRVTLAGIRGYQHFLAPIAAGAGIRCRFSPSCSVYAETVITRDGVVRGGWLALQRIARCGPWTPMGTTDMP